MKKSISTSKLALNRETLRILEQPQLGAVVGGNDTATVRYSNCGSCNTGETTG